MKNPADIPAKSRNTPQDFSQFPKDYRTLFCDILLPRPLHSRKEYRAALHVAETMAGHDLTKDQDDSLDAISTFIEAWETAHEPRLPTASPDEVLHHLLENNGMTGTTFGRLLGVSSSMVSLLLSGKRQLIPANMAILSEQFKISPAVFLPAGGSKTQT